MKSDRNAMVQLNQRSFPTLQESVEAPCQGISPTGKEGLLQSARLMATGGKTLAGGWHGTGNSLCADSSTGPTPTDANPADRTNDRITFGESCC